MSKILTAFTWKPKWFQGPGRVQLFLNQFGNLLQVPCILIAIFSHLKFWKKKCLWSWNINQKLLLRALKSLNPHKIVCVSGGSRAVEAFVDWRGRMYQCHLEKWTKREMVGFESTLKLRSIEHEHPETCVPRQSGLEEWSCGPWIWSYDDYGWKERTCTLVTTKSLQARAREFRNQDSLWFTPCLRRSQQVRK